jgi:3-dehydroquinate synthase
MTNSHRWSPLHELVPETPLRHGHAISIDMAYSATLANQRGLLSDAEHRRILNLFSRAGLSMDHHQFDEDILDKATAAILKTRDGLLRAAVPSPLGSCVFLNDVTAEEMNAALRKHKELMKKYPRNGEGLEAYVDSSDTGYTENAKMEEERFVEAAAKKAGQLNGHAGHVTDAPDGVGAASSKMNGFMKTNGAMSNGTTGNVEINGHAVNGSA